MNDYTDAQVQGFACDQLKETLTLALGQFLTGHPHMHRGSVADVLNDLNHQAHESLEELLRGANHLAEFDSMHFKGRETGCCVSGLAYDDLLKERAQGPGWVSPREAVTRAYGHEQQAS